MKKRFNSEQDLGLLGEKPTKVILIILQQMSLDAYIGMYIATAVS